MNLIKMGSGWLAEASPMGLVLAGGALIIGLPVIRRTVREGALLVTKMALTVGEQAANATTDVRAGWENLVREAKSQMEANTSAATLAGAGLGGVAGGAVGSTVGGAMGGGMGAAVGGTMGAVAGAGMGANMAAGMESEGAYAATNPGTDPEA